jgi:glycosyltransferase involved in cell wall biosynthesis
MTGNPLITVITVVLNRRDDLETTIRSVLDQTYDNIEYVVIDGGSSDGTLEVIRKYSRDIDHWLSETDSGIYDAMNKGILYAHGMWINFMNAGDIFYDSTVIEDIVSTMQGNADVIYGDHQIMYDKDSSKIWKAQVSDQLWKGMIFCHQSVFVRTDLMKQQPFSVSNKLTSDFDLLYSLYRKGYTFLKCDRIIATVSADGLSGSKSVSTAAHHWHTVRRLSGSFKVDAYYIVLILKRLFASIIKSVLPGKWSSFVRARW